MRTRRIPMADEEEKIVEEEKQAGKKKSFLQNRLVIIGIILIVQTGIAVLMGNMLVSHDNKKQEAEAAEHEEESYRGNIVELEDLIVNLRQGDRLYYLKLTVGLEVISSSMQKEVEKRRAHLRDIVISRISGMSMNELDTVEKRNALKMVLHKELSESLTSGDLIQVFFSDFVIQ
jgi:flagellar FliL protein